MDHIKHIKLFSHWHLLSSENIEFEIITYPHKKNTDEKKMDGRVCTS